MRQSPRQGWPILRFDDGLILGRDAPAMIFKRHLKDHGHFQLRRGCYLTYRYAGHANALRQAGGAPMSGLDGVLGRVNN